MERMTHINSQQRDWHRDRRLANTCPECGATLDESGDCPACGYYPTRETEPLDFIDLALLRLSPTALAQRLAE